MIRTLSIFIEEKTKRQGLCQTGDQRLLFFKKKDKLLSGDNMCRILINSFLSSIAIEFLKINNFFL